MAGERVLDAVFCEKKNLICLSHASCLSGKKAETSAPLSHKFICCVASIVSRSALWRGNFYRATGKPPLSKSNVRWYSEYELSRQVLEFLPQIIQLARDENGGGEELRNQLIEIYDRPANDEYSSGAVELQAELHMLRDTVHELALLCYNSEGDAPMLCVTAYENWQNVLKHLKAAAGIRGNPVLPSVTNFAATIFPDDQLAQRKLVQLTASKVKAIYEKMFSDTAVRIIETLNTLRACRLLNYQFICDNHIDTLYDELVWIRQIPMASHIYNDLSDALQEFKAVADRADRTLTHWGFWVKYCIRLPVWYSVAAEAALVVVSSASTERMFSLLSAQIHDNQSCALADYQTNSVILRYNKNQLARK